ncbi:KEOPS complex subunit Pcc1 [Natrialba sp. INN-245]|uniref:KEOPS complex subunit Pcc1 n=1 Tax=Natrialba sp. INN-245 TaxID=2690967 RepID=UPI0013105376|nr:KEOPS complex subunit Pcc1 [Natrialba sp. INN-245]MWV39506.1 KEOPS complex Pcc1-like subunit [Natrialba sp. INN-245]
MSRRATIRTRHDEPELLARTLRPDNTDEMETSVDRTGDAAAVVTRIERETIGGLHSTVDDYVVNLEVAMDVVQHGRETRNDRSEDDRFEGQSDRPTDTGSVSDNEYEHDTQ